MHKVVFAWFPVTVWRVWRHRNIHPLDFLTPEIERRRCGIAWLRKVYRVDGLDGVFHMEIDS